MAVKPEALYSLLTKDLSHHLSVDQEVAALMGCPVPIYPDDSTESYASAHLLNNVFKKLITYQKADAEQKSLDKFLSINDDCRNWKLDKQTWSMKDDLLYSTFRDIVWRVFSRSELMFCNLDFLAPRGALGPGANIGARGSDLYTKLYGSPLSCSRYSIFESYQRFVATSDRLKGAEFRRALEFGHEPTICDSKLSFVPKSNDICRTICTEPTLNMWFQRAYSHQIETVLLDRFNIDLGRQPDINRELARIGSRDDSFSTIDLASASDSISLGLLRDILPREVMCLLMCLRSPFTLLPSGDRCELHMVSSMGNGFTFSLQTLIFSCMVEAVYSVYGIALHKPIASGRSLALGNFSVFGDDIIVEKLAFQPLCRLLNICGFKVNDTKSFSIGPFRESCGADFLYGTNVRPVFIKDLDEKHSLYSTINLLRYWSARLRIPLSRTLNYLKSKVEWLPIPRSAPIETGLQVPFASLSSRFRKLDSNGSILYWSLAAKPDYLYVRGEKIVGPRWEKRRPFNPDGLLLFALVGGLRDGSFAVRSSKPKYRFRSYVSPNWDAPPMGADPLDQSGWARWESESIVFGQH